jgi:hypothetical protein
MDDIGEQPSERDESIYSEWERGGKSLRVLARQFETSVADIERAIDRVLPPFTTANQMRAYKRELQRLEDVGAKYHALAMAENAPPEMAHIFCRVNERRAAMAGWSSINVRLDPFSVQTQQEPTQYEKITQALLRLKYADDGNGSALAPPSDPSADDADPVR